MRARAAEEAARARREAQEKARLEAARRRAAAEAVRNQRMERERRANAPVTQDEVAGLWGVCYIWIIVPAFGCYIADRRPHGRVGLCAGLFWPLCVIPFGPIVDPNASWAPHEHGTDAGPPVCRTCGGYNMAGPCNLINPPTAHPEPFCVTCQTEIRLIPC